jgi:OmpA family
MAKGKDTGKGLVSVDYGTKDPLNRWPIKTILFHNFNFDGDELKPEHITEIEKRLIPQILEKKQVIRISGYASKQGDAKYNRELSLRRVMALRNYLHKHGVPEKLMPWDELRARGEDDSTSKFNDDELDRSVKVEFLPDYKPKPPKPKPKPKHDDPPPPIPPIIHPPVPLPIPQNREETVVLREVYVVRTLISHDPGEFKPDRQSEGWRRINYLSVTGSAPSPFERALDHATDSGQFFISWGEFFTAQRVEFKARAYFYKYDPASTPPSASPWTLPDDRQQCEMMYAGGTPVSSLP